MRSRFMECGWVSWEYTELGLEKHWLTEIDFAQYSQNVPTTWTKADAWRT